MNHTEHRIIIPQENRESNDSQQVAGIPLKEVEGLAMGMPLDELKMWIRFLSMQKDERMRLSQQILQLEQA